MTSLNPVYPIGYQIAEAIRAHHDISRDAAATQAVQLLDAVSIPNPAERVDNYPHELSGGMRQRVVIAIAMANGPDVIIADEPTTALDVTVQAQILDALRTAKEQTGAAMLLITHDLGVIAGQADRVLVMYAGRVVEAGTVEEIFYAPRMPYTLGLLGSQPRLDVRSQRLHPISGAPPSALNLPPGCPFAPRCPLAAPICEAEEPAAGGDRYRRASVGLPLARPAGRPGARGPVPPCLSGHRIVNPPPGTPPPVLEVRNLVKHFPVGGRGLARRRAGEVHAVCDVSFDLYPAGDAGAGRRVRLRQDHHGAGTAEPAAGDRGPRPLPGHRADPAVQQGDAAAAARVADRLPGPLRRARPAAAGQRDHR